MKIVFDTEYLEGLTLQEVFLLACINLCDDREGLVSSILQKCVTMLKDNELINDSMRITTQGRKLLMEVVTGNTTEIDINKLAEKLRDMYPLGKKPGTEFHWRSNPSEVKDRLKRFLKLFSDAKITEEEIIAATERYVREMEYDQLMRLLKYFILKQNPEKEWQSDLYTYICAAREGEGTPAYDNILV